MDDGPGAQLELLGALTGARTTEGRHPLLPGDAITGRATFEWLDGGQFLIQRSHYDHPQIPDAVTVTGVVDDRLSMHYFDSRGVHRLYSGGRGPGGVALLARRPRLPPAVRRHVLRRRRHHHRPRLDGAGRRGLGGRPPADLPQGLSGPALLNAAAD
jgi:hypothetical protein